MSTIKVYLRIRPLVVPAKGSEAIDAVPDSGHSNTPNLTIAKDLKGKSVCIKDGISKEKTYDFEEIFEDRASQETVFEFFKDKIYENAINGVRS